MTSYSIYTRNNKNAVLDSTYCGCISCVEDILASEIVEYTGGPSEDAVCPFCMVDAIVPDSMITYTLEDLRRWNVEGFSYN